MADKAPQSCFLDISYGVSEERDYKIALSDFEDCRNWLSKRGNGYGLPVDIASLAAEEDELAHTLYLADASTGSNGTHIWRSRAPKNHIIGRLVIDLMTEKAPRTCQNFVALCTGSFGKGKSSGKTLHYVGVPFHRIEKGFCLQGGDVVNGDGSGSDSIFGKTFNDEKGGLSVKHERGIVAMANSGRNTNSCQFYITLGPQPKLDGKYVVFGRVRGVGIGIPSGEADRILNEMEASVDRTGGPLTIAACGTLSE